jgi:hypothetical protein
VNLENGTAFSNRPYQSHQSSVDSYKRGFTTPSMVMPVLLGGGGSSVSTSVDHTIRVLTSCTIVINGVISLPVAVLAFFFLPDTPGTAKPNWLFSERVSNLPSTNWKSETLMSLFCCIGNRSC